MDQMFRIRHIMYDMITSYGWLGEMGHLGSPALPLLTAILERSRNFLVTDEIHIILGRLRVMMKDRECFHFPPSCQFDSITLLECPQCSRLEIDSRVSVRSIENQQNPLL